MKQSIYNIIDGHLSKLNNLSKHIDNRRGIIISSLKYNDIKLISNNSTIDDQIILFCILRNECHHINFFIEHYRSLGINTFVFLDNNSDDGTKEYLMKQQGIILYSNTEKFDAAKKLGWLNYLLFLHGLDKYCLVVDADEYISYIGCEKYDFHDIISTMEKKGIKRTGGIMLDMYPKGELFSTTATDFLNDYNYFDYTGYDLLYYRWFGTQVIGGPRKRCFGCKNFLAKIPLFYFSSKDNSILVSNHYILPIEPTKDQMFFALKHYKFLDKIDFEKVKDAVKKQYHFRNSMEYKIYLKNINNTVETQNKYPVFYDDKYSMEFQNSDSLKSISFLKDPFN